ncbi:hypothetical protein LWV33_06280 [Brucella intermedia]
MQFAGRALPSPIENRFCSSLDKVGSSGEWMGRTTMITRLAGFDARKCAVAVSGLAEVRYILALKRETSAITLDANSTRVRAPSSLLLETAPHPFKSTGLEFTKLTPLVLLERL